MASTWRERPLGKIEYLVVDARYEQVRVDNFTANEGMSSVTHTLIASDTTAVFSIIERI
jgi:transposase-like protein